MNVCSLLLELALKGQCGVLDILKCLLVLELTSVAHMHGEKGDV